VNLQRLRYLVIVTEEWNFTRVAARLHTVHSLLSYRIRHLENESAGGERLTSLGGQAREHDSWREPCRTPLVPAADILFAGEIHE
jgi:hypothetical protein